MIARPDPTVARIAACIVLAVAAAPLLPSSARADDAPPVTVDALELAEGLHLVRSNSPVGNPSTVVLETGDGFLLVDPNLLLAADALRGFLDGRGGGPVRWIATTHYHGDHSEGLESFPGATAFAPRPQRERGAAQPVVLGERPVAVAALPDVALEADATLHAGGRTVELLLPPRRDAHTDGDLFVWFREDRVLCAGDHVFLDRFPLVDHDAGGSLDGLLENLRWIAETFPPDTRIVPGHGAFPPDPVRALTIAEIRAYVAALERAVDWVRERLEAGVDVDRLATEIEPPEEIAAFARRPRYVSVERWVRQVHRALQRE